MQAIRIHGPSDLRCDVIDEPAIGPNDVLVKVAAAGICGSDLNYVKVGGVGAPVTEPIGLGHELSGRIHRVGDNVRDLQPGARVIVNPMGSGNAIGNGMIDGAFAPLLRVCNAKLGDSIHLIPDHLSFENAALAEPLSVALHAVNRAEINEQSKVVIFGAGPIGLGIVLWLHRKGLKNIVAVDMSDQRLERAKVLGADVTINPSRDNLSDVIGAVHGHGHHFGLPCVHSDVFFEVSGARSVIPDIINMAGFHSRVVVVAVYHEPVPVSFHSALAKEMTFVTSMAYPNEFPAVISMLADAGSDLSAMISHRFSFNEFFDAFAMAQDRDKSAKVMITFPE